MKNFLKINVLKRTSVILLFLLLDCSSNIVSHDFGIYDKYWNSPIPNNITDCRLVVFQNYKHKQVSYPHIELRIAFPNNHDYSKKIELVNLDGQIKFNLHNDNLYKFPLHYKEIPDSNYFSKNTVYSDHSFTKIAYSYGSKKIEYPKDEILLKQKVISIYYDLSITIKMTDGNVIISKSEGLMAKGIWKNERKKWLEL